MANTQCIRNRRMHVKKRAILAAIKIGKPCMDCGISYPHYVMDFDHREPHRKLRNVSQLVYHGTIKQLLAEIEKCDLVCANCHRIRTHAITPEEV